MKHHYLFLCFIAIGVSTASSAAQAAPPSIAGSLAGAGLYYNVNTAGDAIASGAEKFITKLTDQGIGFLENKEISQEKQTAEFRKLLNQHFDMNTIARFSLGRYWRTASKPQRDEYLKLFKVMIIDVYSSRFSDYEGQKIEVVGSRKEGEKDILVHSVLSQKNGPDVKVDWRVRNRKGQYRVIDVIVEGVSMALTQRSDFSSVVQRGGGDMEALLVHLREN